MFLLLNFRQIWNTDAYYSLLYVQTSICGCIILYQSFLSFTFANLCLLFIVLSIFPHSEYSVLTLLYNVFLLLYTVYLFLHKEPYEEIINIETQKNDEYPEAINMSSFHHNQNYPKQSYMYV